MKKIKRQMNIKWIRKIGCVILLVSVIISMFPMLSPQATAAEVDEGWLWPVSLIKKSGAKGAANIGSAMDENRNGKAHYGLDITGTGRDIFATRSGTVFYVNAKATDSCGVYVILKHTDVMVNGKAETRYSWYLHMVSGSIPEGIKKGVQIKQGDKIGEVGDSAVPKLPAGNIHLHFGVGKSYKGTTKQYWVTDFINVNPDENSLENITVQSQVKTSALKKEWRGERMSYIFSPSQDDQKDTSSVSKPGKYITINDSRTPNSHVFDMPQSSAPAKKIAELVPGTIVTIVSVEKNAAGIEWGKLANRNSYVAMDRLTAYKAPSWTSLASDKQSYVTADENIKVYTDPSSYSSEVRTISAANTAVTIVATTKNAAGNMWGKIKDGECIYMGSVKEAPTNTVSTNTASTLTISGQTIPGNTHTKGKTFICKGTISSNYNITSVTVGVYDTNGKMVTGGSATPNAKSYNIQSTLDAKVRFDQLDSGTYTYRVNATDASGMSITPVAEKFTVSDVTEKTGTVTIKYNANGGSGVPASHTIAKDKDGSARYTLSSTKPTRDGYDFLGWRLENDTAYGIDSPGQSIAIGLGSPSSNATLTYYAQWKAKSSSGNSGYTLDGYNCTKIEKNMTVSVGKGNTLRFARSVSAKSNDLTAIPNGKSVYVYGVTIGTFPNKSGTYINWAKISYNGQTGWVNYAYLK